MQQRALSVFMKRKSLTLAASLALSAVTLNLAAAPVRSCPSQNPHAFAERSAIGIASGISTGSYVRFAQDIANVLRKDCSFDMRVAPRLGYGSVQNLADLMWHEQIDVAIVQEDLLDAINQGRNSIESVDMSDEDVKKIKANITYILGLVDQELHILARPEISTVRQLDGKKVSIGIPGSGSGLTFANVQKAMRIKVEPVHADPYEAIRLLREENISAAIFIVSKKAPYLTELNSSYESSCAKDDTTTSAISSKKQCNEKLHLLSVEASELNSTQSFKYKNARITKNDYEHLIGESNSIETVSVKAVLATVKHKNPERNERVRVFAQKLLANIDNLKNPEIFDPKWRDVEPCSSVAGWKRMDAACEFIRSGSDKAKFRCSSDELKHCASSR